MPRPKTNTNPTKTMEFTARNTNSLALKIYPALMNLGREASTRNGTAIRFDEVVTVKILQPCERVNFSSARDCNPFFHLVEAMAMICGHNSVPLMGHYAKNMLSYSDDGRTFNAFYGTRMHAFQQMETVIENLRKNPDSRQELIVLWDIADLTKATKDKACNFAMLFEVVDHRLRMITFNRSNDAVWGGVTGANVVHFSFFLEFVAAALDLDVGSWSHVSANLHAYAANPKLQAVLSEAALGHSVGGSADYPQMVPLDQGSASQFEYLDFMHELNSFFEFHEYVLQDPEAGTLADWEGDFSFPFLVNTFLPMVLLHESFKLGFRDPEIIKNLLGQIEADDWRTAAYMWLRRRISTLP